MFSNISLASRVSSLLLSQFGKNTKVVIEVHGHVFTVRKCWDNKVVATGYCVSPDIVAVYTPNNDVPTMFHGREIGDGTMAVWFMERNSWPRAGRTDRVWSRASYKPSEAL